MGRGTFTFSSECQYFDKETKATSFFKMSGSLPRNLIYSYALNQKIKWKYNRFTEHWKNLWWILKMGLELLIKYGL